MGAIPGIEQNYQYLEYGKNNIGRLGGLTVQPRVEGAGRVGGGQPAGGLVPGEDGVTGISQGVQGVGLGTTYAEGAGSHYTNGMGHAEHTKWLIA